ncbi:MAG: LON peptidase substrate-binding domain-containing protein [Alphaproteobacteria bacterium]|nr:LON peptidase substrate-binding domain-containing protein [Alphaproteobacteria bacterium]
MRLPLNIFEPRYLTMLDDALKSARMIGMIQPAMGAEGHSPEIYPIGCAARITQFGETEDGRYLITLTGICRFRVGAEAKAMTPYRFVHPDYREFEDDLYEAEPIGIDRERLGTALNLYLKGQNFEADMSLVARAPEEMLINSLAMICPFSVSEKQALLEAPTLADRASTLLMLLEMAVAARDSGGSHSLQ